MIMTNSLATTMIVISIRMSTIRVINLHRFDCVSEVCVYVGRKTRREGWWVGMKEGGPWKEEDWRVRREKGEDREKRRHGGSKTREEAEREENSQGH